MAYTYVFILLICIISSVFGIVTKGKKSTNSSHNCQTPDKLHGSCVPLWQCKKIVNFKPTTVYEQEALSSYKCRSGQDQENVCCPNQGLNLDWIYDDCMTPDQSNGKCKPIWSCKYLIEYLNTTNINNEIKSTMRKYICSDKHINSRNPMVCCPSKPIMKPERYGAVDSALLDHSQHRNAHLLRNKYCGQSNEYRIIAGKETEPFDFPWMAVIKYWNGNSLEFDCGGTLINNRYILTAAHCIRPKNKNIIGVRLGEHDITKEKDCLTGGVSQIDCTQYQDFCVSSKDAIVHSEYNPDNGENDIALIRLREEPNTSDFSVAPICLPITTEEKANKVQNYTLIGWGLTEKGRQSDILLKTEVPSQNSSRCPTISQLDSKHICAGGVGETDACAGDSGGPLMAGYTNDRAYKIVQYGVIARGPWGCAKENSPSVHTKVAAYMDWILNNLSS